MGVSYVEARPKRRRVVLPAVPPAGWPAWTDEVVATPTCGSIERWGRNWAVYDQLGALVAVCVYKRGALEVLHRLERRIS